jgi:transcriptional regulator of acetoin/glycerol metabolism
MPSPDSSRGRPLTSWSDVDPQERERILAAAHDAFLATGRTDPRIRSLVAESWERSLSAGLDPEYSRAPVDLLDDELESWRDAHPLSRVIPVIRRLLVDDATDAGLLVAVSDAAGQMLWIEGDHHLKERASAMHFVEGSNWSEAYAGTNAPGTALALDAAVHILGAEHLFRPVVPWSCSAAPIHDPTTGAILGSLDITGGPEVATRQSLALVKATVAAVEGELRVQRLMDVRPSRHTPHATPTLDVLGRHRATLHSAGQVTQLSLRHSELLLLLSLATDGLSSGELGVALHVDESSPITVRAEITRLRSLLSGLSISSRPYRLDPRPQTDVDLLRRHLDHGRWARAVDIYQGPALPQSEAPAIAQLRDDLHHRLRAGLIAARDVDAILRFADTDHGRDDLEVWRSALALLPVNSPRRAEVAAHVDRLSTELG